MLDHDEYPFILIIGHCYYCMYCTVHKKYWVENVNIPVSLLFVSDGSCSDMVEVWYGGSSGSQSFTLFYRSFTNQFD